MDMKIESKNKTKAPSKPKGERIAKVMARAGLCSRREAERWIAEGRVRVNKIVLETAACVVGPDDRIVVDGKPLPQKERPRLFVYHKPAGLVTSNRDERGRETVFDRFPKEMPRVVTVGRLDINTEGLLLLTNDGELARYMELPATGWVRRYRVRVLGNVDPKRLERLKNGITVEGVRYGSIDARLADEQKEGANSWIIVSLSEGKNREVRRVMEAIGLKVNRLIRVSYGPFQLGNQEKHVVHEIPEKIMKDQLQGFFNAR